MHETPGKELWLSKAQTRAGAWLVGRFQRGLQGLLFVWLVLDWFEFPKWWFRLPFMDGACVRCCPGPEGWCAPIKERTSPRPPAPRLGSGRTGPLPGNSVLGCAGLQLDRRHRPPVIGQRGGLKPGLLWIRFENLIAKVMYYLRAQVHIA